MNKKEILKNTWVYYLATQLTQVITFATSILLRRYLGPVQTGIWSALQVIVDYSKYTSLGMMDAAAREIPVHAGRQESKEAEDIKNGAFSFVMLNSAILSLGIIIAAFVFQARLTKTFFWGLLLIAGIVFLQRLNNMLIAFLRCYKKFSVESGLMIWSAIVNALLIAILSYRFKIYGFMVAMIASYLFNIIYAFKKYPFNFSWDYHLGKIRPLMTFGLPLMGLNVIITVYKSLDRLLIARWLSFESLGYYSVAIMVVSYLSNFPAALGIVFLPYLREKYGQSDDPKSLKQYLLKMSSGLTVVMCLLILGVWTLAPAAIRFFLPHFTPGIPSVKIIVLGIFFISLGQIYHDYLVTLKKIKALYFIYPLAAALTIGANAYFVARGGGIESFAFVSVGVSAVIFSFLCFWSARYSASLQNSFRSFLGAFLGLFYMAATHRVMASAGDELLRQSAAAFMMSIPLLIIFLYYYGVPGLRQFYKTEEKTNRG